VDKSQAIHLDDEGGGNGADLLRCACGRFGRGLFICTDEAVRDSRVGRNLENRMVDGGGGATGVPGIHMGHTILYHCGTHIALRRDIQLRLTLGVNSD
jgi:hypothetical protein